MIDLDDTIVAIASPATPAPRGIVRLSGTDAVTLVNRVCAHAPTCKSERHGAATEPGYASDVASEPPPSTERPKRVSRTIDLGSPLGIVPVDLMTWPTRRSYTGEPSAEIHTIGSVPLLQAIIGKLTSAGARAARPGEFTMRAFLAGRLDLTQAEAVLGVIEADGRGALDHALQQLAGNLSRPLEAMRETMLNLLADVEAGLDFVDEDIEFIDDETLIARLSEIDQQLAATVRMMQSREGGSSRMTVALRGEPNAGKSRLLNALVGKEAALVADVAGTTRDTVTVEVELDSHKLTLIDTAGIETGANEIARLSQAEGTRAAAAADVRLWCVDQSRPDATEAMRRIESELDEEDSRGINLLVMTKSDLSLTESDAASPFLSTSAATGAGLRRLRDAIRQAVESRDRQETGGVAGTAARCQQSLSTARAAIAAAIELTRRHAGHEFVASELRMSVTSIGEVTGAVYTDDILDRVFGRFCIGK